MKKQFAYLLTAIILSSCASMNDGDARIANCMETSSDGFWGKCFIEESNSNYFFRRDLDALNLESRWKIMTRRTEVLERKLADGEITADEANLQFEKNLGEIRRIYEERARKKAEADRLALQQLSQSLKEANQNLSGNQGYSSRGSSAFFIREETTGMGKICYYDDTGTTKAINVSSVDICPLSYKF